MLGLLALAGCGGSETPEVTDPNAVSMSSNAFNPSERTLSKGDKLTLVNEGDSAPHIIVTGTDGNQADAPGAPDFGGLGGIRTNAGDVWVSDPWNTPGTFHVTCTVHPDMNLVVTVSES